MMLMVAAISLTIAGCNQGSDTTTAPPPASVTTTEQASQQPTTATQPVAPINTSITHGLTGVTGLPTESNKIPPCELMTPGVAKLMGSDPAKDLYERQPTHPALRMCESHKKGLVITGQHDRQCWDYFHPGIGEEIRADYVPQDRLPAGIKLAVMTGNTTAKDQTRILSFCINSDNGRGYLVRASGKNLTTENATKALAELGPQAIEVYKKYYG